MRVPFLRTVRCWWRPRINPPSLTSTDWVQENERVRRASFFTRTYSKWMMQVNPE